MNNSESRDFILKGVNAALRNRRLYPPGHPAIASHIAKTFGALQESLKTRDSLMIALIAEALVFEADLVTEGERLYPDIVQHMADRGIDAIVFERGATERELAGFLDVFDGAEGLKGPTIEAELLKKGVSHIRLRSVQSGKKNLLEVYNEAVDIVKNAMAEVRMGKIPKADPVKRIIGDITDSVFSDQNAILGLAMIKNYDNYLYNHSVNVSIFSLSLAKALGLDKDVLHAVGIGALLHDIGKTGVSEKIIRKPSGLSSEEWERVKEHPVLGSNIIKRMEGVEELVGRLIYEHHVRYDHSGYPQTAATPHPLSQVITITDAYDALTTLRVYQQPYTPPDALKIMSSLSGRHFNPDTLMAFVTMIGLYPVGTMVRLSTGEIGVVTKVNPASVDYPAVRPVCDGNGNPIKDAAEMELSERKDVSIISVVNPAITTTDVGAFFEKEAAG
jgi:putative nucleotidyltransferase with HDIG domain